MPSVMNFRRASGPTWRSYLTYTECSGTCILSASSAAKSLLQALFMLLLQSLDWSLLAYTCALAFHGIRSVFNAVPAPHMVLCLCASSAFYPMVHIVFPA
eukprot:1157853-Pelagomonas_calceolata.AAC.9